MRKTETMKKTMLKAMMMAMMICMLSALPATAPAADGPCDGLTPTLITTTPHDGRADVAQDLLLSGTNFRKPDGTLNVTSVFAVEVGNPANVIQATNYNVINPNLIDVFFNFGAGNACKTFQIMVNGPCGASESAASESAANARFTTLCPPPAQRIAILGDTIEALRAADVLNQKQAKPLIKKLNKAGNKLEIGKKAAAVAQLQLFIAAVEELNVNGVFSSTQGGVLVDQASSIIAQINQ